MERLRLTLGNGSHYGPSSRMRNTSRQTSYVVLVGAWAPVVVIVALRSTFEAMFLAPEAQPASEELVLSSLLPTTTVGLTCPLVINPGPSRRELLHLSCDMCLVQPPDTILSLTTRYVNEVGRGSVFRSRRRTLVVLVVLVLGRRQEAHRLHYFLRRRSVHRLHLRLKVLSWCVENLLRPSSDTCLVQPPDVKLPLTTRYVNAVGRGSVFPSRRRTQVVLVLSQMRGGTSTALFLRRSDARAVVYRPTKPHHLRLQKKRRRRSCCPVFLCSSPSTRDVGMFSPHMTMGYFSSPIQRDVASMVMSA